jgi:hypothetical protein
VPFETVAIGYSASPPDLRFRHLPPPSVRALARSWLAELESVPWGTTRACSSVPRTRSTAAPDQAAGLSGVHGGADLLGRSCRIMLYGHGKRGADGPRPPYSRKASPTGTTTSTVNSNGSSASPPTHASHGRAKVSSSGQEHAQGRARQVMSTRGGSPSCWWEKVSTLRQSKVRRSGIPSSWLIGRQPAGR